MKTLHLFLYHNLISKCLKLRLNATHYFIMTTPIKREIQQIASNHLSGIEFKDFMKLCKYYTKEKFSFLVKDTTLPSCNSLRFRKRLL